MQRTNCENFVNFLEKNVFDNCMLLPVFANNVIVLQKEYYVSRESFLCVIKYKDEYEMPPQIELFAQDTDTESEIIEQLFRLKGEYCLVSYKSDTILKNPKISQYISSNVNFFRSYHAKETCLIRTKSDVFISQIVQNVDENFLKQSGNHLTAILNDMNKNLSENQVIYLSKNGSVIGYIALKKQYKNIWDVAFIFVDERERGKGYGVNLCSYASDYLAKSGRVLFKRNDVIDVIP